MLTMMTLNELVLLSDAIERISDITDVSIPEVVDVLTGIAWKEEIADRIKQYHADEDFI